MHSKNEGMTAFNPMPSGLWDTGLAISAAASQACDTYVINITRANNRSKDVSVQRCLFPRQTKFGILLC